MKKQILLVMCLIFLGTGAAFAEPYQTHTREVGMEIFNFTYQEPDVMKDTGLMYGIVGSYAYHRNWMLKFEGRGSWGQVDYSSNISGEAHNINEWTLELRALGGYDFTFLKTVTITPYIGTGYRYLYDASDGVITTKNHYGYDREANYYYSPVGVTALIDLKNGWALGATAEYDIFWWGRQKSHLSDVPGYYDIVNQQKNGYGARGSLLIQKKIKKIAVMVEPFIRYWNISDSDYTTDAANRTWYEPGNNTTETGVRLGIKF